MNTKVLLLTPPFTQLNTPYPATMYIKGFLNTQNIESFQVDLGIEAMLGLLNEQKLTEMFDAVEASDLEISENAYRMLTLRNEYQATIKPVIRFLQNKNSTLGYGIAEGGFLPRAARFAQLGDLELAFGNIGIQDKARHFATLYLQDISDFIRETLDPFFGFSRYAERIGHSATSFDELASLLAQETTLVDDVTLSTLANHLINYQPSLVLISVPFPGNLYAAFRCAQYIKTNHPEVKISLGGGFPNTELRSLKEPRVFDYFDFITLDDGERPVLNIIEYLEEKRDVKQLKRTYIRQEGKVVYLNGGIERDFSFAQVGTPDYTDIDITQYLSVLELVNPMHRLWSDGRWNKLTMAHGCYWKKCSFCDISLDYIGSYEPVTAQIICDRMQEQIDTTGETGFHFVDEAAPPALMREVALELLRRRMVVTWWANIRFESSFSADLCVLLAKSGCIAVSGGLEVASDRLLELMQKGVTVEQVAQVAHSFTAAGILVHAYLMYGFPTQTDQETIDSLEMVRQLFEQGVIQSGFWHQFAMTAHSPVGLDPEKFEVIRTGPEQGDFAYNDLSHEDPKGADHEVYGEGLSKSLFNYMHGNCLDFELNEWFDFEVPLPSIAPDYIHTAIQNKTDEGSDSRKVVWIGSKPEIQKFRDEDTQEIFSMVSLESKFGSVELETSPEVGQWIAHLIEQCTYQQSKPVTMKTIKDQFEDQTGIENELLTQLEEWQQLKTNGLLIL